MVGTKYPLCGPKARFRRANKTDRSLQRSGPRVLFVQSSVVSIASDVATTNGRTKSVDGEIVPVEHSVQTWRESPVLQGASAKEPALATPKKWATKRVQQRVVGERLRTCALVFTSTNQLLARNVRSITKKLEIRD